MQPLVREIQRKHKGNRQKVYEETQALYRSTASTSSAGCLPVVLQLPILFALYQALIRASGVVTGFTVNDGNQAAFDQLQAADLIVPARAPASTSSRSSRAVQPAGVQPAAAVPAAELPAHRSDQADRGGRHAVDWLFGLDLARVDHVFAITIFGGFALSGLAIIAAILQFVQVKMTSPRPNADDPTSSMTSTMTYTFPLLTIFWGGIFPSGLILYWITYTAYLVIQQYLIMGWGNLFPHLRLAATVGSPRRRRGSRRRRVRSARTRPMRQRTPSTPIPAPRRRAAAAIIRGPRTGDRAAPSDEAEAMTFREFTGKNVEEAIRTAMKEFSADLGDLDIEILSQGSRGILGVGGEEARILAAPKSAVAAAETIRAEPAEEPDHASRPRPAEPAEPSRGTAPRSPLPDGGGRSRCRETRCRTDCRRPGRRPGAGRRPPLARRTRSWWSRPQRPRARARHPRAVRRTGAARAATGPTAARAGAVRARASPTRSSATRSARRSRPPGPCSPR